MGYRTAVAVAALPLTAVLLTPPLATADPGWIPGIGTGSVEPGSVSGSFEGTPMELGPKEPIYRPLGIGSASATPAAAEPEPVVTADIPPQPDAGSVQSACVGGLALGSALIMLGSATGSVTGSGLIPGLIGPGSSGSGTGSAALGSAVTGSALLCLLLPLQSPPGIPMELGPLPTVPVPGPGPADPVPTLVEPTPETPRPVAAPRSPVPDRVVPPEDPEAFNLLQLMTLLVITILSTVRAVAAGRRR
ncbi:hypothetical protein ACFVMC_29780 [Nocardia sp. NPDC127579]|uniref:hypothetical protein n=1 Tax=Nocardia sp. NPDC127579 TaxID=3345402 RepID=UPI0036449840